ncbi:MAG: hypothetical protein HZC11_00050 [Nitrospirae bacterium]|nr:hypothetical protein [Nitrospirota bacterium]
MKKGLFITVFAVSMFLFAAMAFAVPSADILYYETELESGLLWQYDYTFYNTTAGSEYLYSVWFDFDGDHEFTGLPLPTGWDGIAGEPTTSFAMVFAMDPMGSDDIAPGNSLSGFSFVIDYQAGNIPYTAYFSDHEGGYSSLAGTTALAPEPISSILFLTGGAALAVRRYLKKTT